MCVKNDFSDLEGRTAWCVTHDSEAQEIGTRGRRLANSTVAGTELPRAAGAIFQASRSWGEGLSVPSRIPPTGRNTIDNQWFPVTIHPVATFMEEECLRARHHLVGVW
jgi:hypothetical protein